MKTNPDIDPLYISETVIANGTDISKQDDRCATIEFIYDTNDNDDDLMKSAISAIQSDIDKKKRFNIKKKRFRDNVSAEEHEKRKERAAYLARVRRNNLSAEQKLKARQADRERAKVKRANETPSQRANRLAKDAERKRYRRRELDQFKQLLDELDTAKRSRQKL